MRTYVGVSKRVHVRPGTTGWTIYRVLAFLLKWFVIATIIVAIINGPGTGS